MRKVGDVGAEVGRLSSWEARRAALLIGRVPSRPSSLLPCCPGPGGDRWEVARAPVHTLRSGQRGRRRGFLAPGRRAGPALQGPVRCGRGGGDLTQGQLHGRRLSRRALDHPGPGRRERSDRRTQRVAVASTRVSLGHHAGRQFSPPMRGTFCFFVAGVSATTMAAEEDAVPGPHCMKKGDPPANDGGRSPQGGERQRLRRRAASALRSRGAPAAVPTAPGRAGSAGSRWWSGLRAGLR